MQLLPRAVCIMYRNKLVKHQPGETAAHPGRSIPNPLFRLIENMCLFPACVDRSFAYAGTRLQCKIYAQLSFLCHERT